MGCCVDEADEAVERLRDGERKALKGIGNTEEWHGNAIPTTNSPNSQEQSVTLTRNGTNSVNAASVPADRLLSPFEANTDEWTETLPATEHVKVFQNTNWSATPLGPLSEWSALLRVYTCNVFADSQAATLYWGPQRIAIYNEAFAPLAGKLHPNNLMGVGFGVAFAEIDEAMAPVFAMAAASGRAADVHEMEMFVERNQFVEETFFTGNFNPLRGLTGSVEGYYNAVHEVTMVKINERRRGMLNRMTAPPTGDMEHLADYVLPALETNPRDVTMALLYKVEEHIDAVPGTGLLSLRGQIGIPEGHSLCARSVDIRSNEGLASFLRKSKSKITTIPIDENFAGVEWRGFDEGSKFATILPIIGLEERLFGFLVVGTNSRRPLDEDHDQFMQDLSSKVVQIFAAVISADETRRRTERLERKVEESTKEIRYLAENASVGMAYLTPNGIIKWTNPQFLAISGHTGEEDFQDLMSFVNVFVDEDIAPALDSWKVVLEGKDNISLELRLKRLYQPPLGEAEHARVLCHASARLEDGVVQSVMAIMTDVSSFRWAEAAESRRATQAEEAKRSQEDFIDFVSHELRNPLSAIFQLAETILSSFPVNDETTSVTPESLTEAVNSNIDNAATILQCAEHQKRLIDDVLTLSKLEYTMLSVSPRPTKLPALVERWMRMFETQLIAYGIHLNIVPNASVADRSNTWVLCDESRVQQIFLNLMTNAIKFTKSEKRRELTVEYGAVVADPKEAFSSDIIWAPNQQELKDLTLGSAWGLGRPIYLTFAVKDTGIGMTGEEIHRLFGRFEQANARTTIKYGGSGLGLFLSQRLAERQAGAIGVASEQGKGSTFAFYIKSRRVEDSAIPASLLPPQPVPSRSVTYTADSSTNSIPQEIHVLLVEDNIVNQRVVQKQLMKAGCIVHVANHGVEALEMIRDSDLWYEATEEAKHLDIVLMDWEMPIMDGLTCTREIRKLEKIGHLRRHVEIIATTANARDEQIAMALASGCDFVVSKPFLVKDLLATIRERLQRSDLRVDLPPRMMTAP